MEKLGQFKTTGTSMDMEMIPQGGEYAEGLKKNLERIKLPSGFKIGLYAVVPDARHMAIGPSTGMVFVGTRKTKVWAVTDRNKDRVADEVKVFAPSVEFTLPNGVCFTKDGFLYVVEQNRVLLFPAAEFFYEGPDVVAVPVVAQGKLIPVEEESYNHTARVCDIGPDNKLYVSLGQPFNVPPRKRRISTTNGASAASSAWIATARIARSSSAASAIRSARISTRPPANSGSTTIRSTAWATTSRRAN